MCLIIASPVGKVIPEEYIHDAASINRDGGGVAWLDKSANIIKFKKNLKSDEVVEILKKLPEATPHVVHFRIASVGAVLPELTHPFVISKESPLDLEGEAESVLFQNGTFSEWRERLLQAALYQRLKVPTPPWSDSRATAILCALYGKHILSILGDHSRWLVFDALADKKCISLWGDWHDKNGFKFSNSGSCAFRTGGAANFPNRATQQTGVTREQTQTSSTEKSTASGSNITAAETRNHPRYTIKTGHNPWKHFTEAGLSLVADNEVPA